MKPRPNSLRSLPAVETLLRHPSLEGALRRLPRALVVEAVRAEIAGERQRLGRSRAQPVDTDAIAQGAARRAEAGTRPELRRVLNATGVVLHTNLGRAPLSARALHAVQEAGRGYCSLEFDLATGARGNRGSGVERWLTRLTGAEAALAVNNGAAAVLLVLSALAAGKRVIVSRGELVEIGGSFRIPEVLEKSGASLLEVGTTNRTHLRDYQRALESHRDVGAILRVHRSNFEVVGFTTRPAPDELARLAHRRRVPLIEDLGSGALVDLAAFGLRHEPTVREALTAGCDVVTFSGDKLLGAPQAGLIVGRKRWLDRVRRDPLARALRLDKLSLAALEATLPAYLDPEQARGEIPALVMLTADEETLERRARELAASLERAIPELRVEVVRAEGEVGGGALPLQKLAGRAVAIDWPGHAPQEVDALARAGDPPVIGFIRAGRYRLDVRTLVENEIVEVVESLRGARDSAASAGSDAGHSRAAERE